MKQWPSGCSVCWLRCELPHACRLWDVTSTLAVRRCRLGVCRACADHPCRHTGAPEPVAVCLGSGSLHGFAHIGAIRAFESLGFRPDIIAGTSVGALAGVLWAAGLPAERIEAIARDTRWRDSGQWRWPRLGFGTLEGLQQLIDANVGSLESLHSRFLAVVHRSGHRSSL